MAERPTSDVTRDGWGARTVRGGRLDNGFSRLEIHHAVNPQQPANVGATMRAIETQHRPRYGDVFYSELVAGDGTTIEGRWTGHPFMGDETYSLCLFGNFENDTPTDAQMRVVEDRAGRFGGTRNVDWHQRRVTETGRGAASACPGRHLIDRLETMRNPPTPAPAPAAATAAAPLIDGIGGRVKSATIKGLYLEFLGWMPSPQEVAYWGGQLDAGWTAERIGRHMATTTRDVL